MFRLYVPNFTDKQTIICKVFESLKGFLWSTCVISKTFILRQRACGWDSKINWIVLTVQKNIQHCYIQTLCICLFLFMFVEYDRPHAVFWMPLLLFWNIMLSTALMVKVMSKALCTIMHFCIHPMTPCTPYLVALPVPGGESARL